MLTKNAPPALVEAMQKAEFAKNTLRSLKISLLSLKATMQPDMAGRLVQPLVDITVTCVDVIGTHVMEDLEQLEIDLALYNEPEKQDGVKFK